MTNDHESLTTLARKIAREHGRDFDAPRAHKNYWIRQARSVVVFQERQPTDIVSRCLRSFGFRV